MWEKWYLTQELLLTLTFFILHVFFNGNDTIVSPTCHLLSAHTVQAALIPLKYDRFAKPVWLPFTGPASLQALLPHLALPVAFFFLSFWKAKAEISCVFVAQFLLSATNS